jgi:hypothetical protein
MYKKNMADTLGTSISQFCQATELHAGRVNLDFSLLFYMNINEGGKIIHCLKNEMTSSKCAYKDTR